MSIVLSTDALIGNHFLEAQSATKQLVMYRRKENNVYVESKISLSSTFEPQTLPGGRELYYSNLIPKILLFIHPTLPNFKIPSLPNLSYKQLESLTSLLDKDWHSIKYTEALSWCSKVNGHVGDYSTFIFSNNSLLNILKTQLPKDSITVFDIVTNSLKDVVVEDLPLNPRTPKVFFLNLPFIKANNTIVNHNVMVLPKCSAKLYATYGKTIHEFMIKYLNSGAAAFNKPIDLTNLNSLTKNWNVLAELLTPEDANKIDTELQVDKDFKAEPLFIPRPSQEYILLKERAKEFQTKTNLLNTLLSEDLSVTKNVESNQNLIKDLELKLKGYLETHQKIKESLTIAKTNSNLAAEIYLNTLKNTKTFCKFLGLGLLSNYSLQAITIETMYNSYTELDLNTEDKYSIFLKELIEEKDRIQSLNIELQTIKPSILYVDKAEKGTNTTLVVAGPYRISIGYSYRGDLIGKIYPLDLSSIIGISPAIGDIVNIKAHPHSAATAMNRKDVKSIKSAYNKPTKICFGEAEANIKRAISEGDLGQLFYAVDSWVTSVNSKDQWGAEYTWFPLYEEG
jgi:hypothetical protein